MAMIIALPKGRLGEDTEAILMKAKITENPISKDSRKLIFPVGNDIEIILVRAWDVPTYVEMGTADIGICGKDDLIEHDADVLELLDLGSGYCKMTIACKNRVSRDELLSKNHLKVATKYPNIAKKMFSHLSIQAEIIKLYGSVELAAVMGMSDCIIDIVSTGGTLRDNGLWVVEELFESTARVIINRSSYYQNLEWMTSFVDKLQKCITVSGDNHEK
jgi:ATP phosphoribosyltransferase